MGIKADGWEGQLYIGSAFALFRGLAGDNAPHRHYAAQYAYGEGTDVVIERANGVPERARGLYIPSEEVHRLRPGKTAVRLLYFEPAMARRREPAAITGMLASTDWKELDWAAFFALPAGLDDRLRRALGFLEDNLDDTFGAAALASAAGLSRNRFMALFSAELGVPVRRYILWRRLNRAALAVAAGASLTTAAHAAGFADSAHFSRTIKAMFGVTATKSLQQLDIIVL